MFAPRVGNGFAWGQISTGAAAPLLWGLMLLMRRKIAPKSAANAAFDE